MSYFLFLLFLISINCFEKKTRMEVKDNEEFETKEILDNLMENDIKNKADNNSNLHIKNIFICNNKKKYNLNFKTK